MEKCQEFGLQRVMTNRTMIFQTMCGRIYGYQHNAGTWDDLGCDNKAPFICETMRSMQYPAEILLAHY